MDTQVIKVMALGHVGGFVGGMGGLLVGGLIFGVRADGAPSATASLMTALCCVGGALVGTYYGTKLGMK